MEQLQKSQSITIDETHREVHFSVGGLWDLQSMKDFLAEMDKQAAPLVMRGSRFNSLGMMRDLVPQKQEVADYIRRHLMAARDAGLTRIAIVEPPLLVKMQYRRVSDGLEVQFFDSKAAALEWLRS